MKTNLKFMSEEIRHNFAKKKVFVASATLVTLLIGAFILFSFTMAHTGGNDWTSGKDLGWAPDNYDPRFNKYGDYYYTDTMYLRWNTASANAIKNSGHRYTQDNNDESDSTKNARFEATGNWGTNFPDPSFDRDNNVWFDCTGADEAEVTSKNANFPTPEANYYTTFQWFRRCNGSGSMYYTGQLSDWYWEWQTRHYDLLYARYYSYSGALNPLGKIFAFVQKYIPYISAQSEGSVLDYGNDKGNYSYKVKKLANSREVDVDVEQKINSKEDLEKYSFFVANEVKKLQKENLSKAKAVVTFNSPQKIEEFIDFVNRNEISVDSFEMRAIDGKGEKITIGGVPEKDGVANPVKVFSEIRNSPAMKEVKNLQLKGVVSFEGEINLKDYEEINSRPTVYLIDILPEVVTNEIKKSGKIEKGNFIDVSVNDVFWRVEEYEK